LLARAEIHEHLRAAWNSARLWTVGRYLLMPDHIHFFAAPAVAPMEPLAVWVRYWKSYASRHWPFRDEQPVWQTDFWDTQFRKAESYSEKWEYVRNNPVRAGLVGQPDAWPYQGEMTNLPWYK
jgi:REP element-mobilizing transposase RayT